MMLFLVNDNRNVIEGELERRTQLVEGTVCKLYRETGRDRLGMKFGPKKIKNLAPNELEIWP